MSAERYVVLTLGVLVVIMAGAVYLVLQEQSPRYQARETFQQEQRDSVYLRELRRLHDSAARAP